MVFGRSVELTTSQTPLFLQFGSIIVIVNFTHGVLLFESEEFGFPQPNHRVTLRMSIAIKMKLCYKHYRRGWPNTFDGAQPCWSATASRVPRRTVEKYKTLKFEPVTKINVLTSPINLKSVRRKDEIDLTGNDTNGAARVRPDRV